MINQFDHLFQTIFESYSIPELSPETDFDSLLNAETLKVFRSSARPNKQSYSSGFHAGSKDQALWRADYQVNDEENYDKYYLYEIVLNLGNVYPELVEDDGSDHDISYRSDLAEKYDTLVYKNVGEGSIKNNNLSVIVLNPENIISNKIVEVLTGEKLEDYINS